MKYVHQYIYHSRLKRKWSRTVSLVASTNSQRMGRGVRSSGGGESQLGYLFGSENPPWPKASGNRPAVAAPRPTQPELQSPAGLVTNAHAEKAGPAAVTAASVSRQNGKAEENAAALTHKLGRNFNNYHRADGQNTGNFITVSSVSTNSSGNNTGISSFTLLTKLCKFSLLSSIVMSADAAYPPLGDYGVSNDVESWSMYPSFGGYSPWKLALTSA